MFWHFHDSVNEAVDPSVRLFFATYLTTLFFHVVHLIEFHIFEEHLKNMKFHHLMVSEKRLIIAYCFPTQTCYNRRKYHKYICHIFYAFKKTSLKPIMTNFSIILKPMN